MLGRVQQIDQLYILDTLAESRIYCSTVAKDQLTVIKDRSINKNPPVWEQNWGSSVKIFTLNISSLRDKMIDLKADPLLQMADLAIFVETHLEPERTTEDLQLDGFQLHANSVGKGKGVAVYIKEGRFRVDGQYKDRDLQITKVSSSNLTAIGVYRSQGDKSLAQLLPVFIPKELTANCIVSGDLNLCPRKEPNHPVFIKLRELGFRYKIDKCWLRIY